MNAIRGTLLFLAGALAGLLLDFDNSGQQFSESSRAEIEIEGPRVVMLNHIGITVEDMEESLAFYTQTLGFVNMFSLRNDNGELIQAYVKIGEDTFFELTPSNGTRPTGITHVGLQVEGMDSVIEAFQLRGAEPSPPRMGGTKAILSYIFDPQEVPIELAEYPPDSLQGKVLAID